MLKIPPPRLLPATIAVLAALLVLKCGILVQAMMTDGAKPGNAIVTVANAAGTDQTKESSKAPAPAKPVPPPVPAAPAVAEGPPPVSDSERSLLQELRQRRQDLDLRTAAVAARESVLAASEQKLSVRLTELQTIQKQLEDMDAAHKQKEDAGWQGLVKLYEDMKPRDAATIFNDLAMPVLLQVVGRMKDAKAAGVMAAMNPEKARDVTEQLARMRTGHDAASAPVPDRKPVVAGG